MPENLLTANMSSFETGTLGYFAFNATAERYLGNSWHGNYSLKVSVSLAQEGLDGYAYVANIDLPPSTTYTWQARVYIPVATSLYLQGYTLMENGGAFRQVAPAGGSTTAYGVGWHLIGGTGTTASDWYSHSRILLRPPRKADNSGYDSTKALYYDALMLEESSSMSPWVLGGEDYQSQSFSPDAVLASSGFANATTPNIAFIQDDPESPDANSFS